ncbi:hypothetical protein HRbin10_00403 [bacterium HR10]|nr:hypothetical protein HRbin10_00403 [bacterium HR10]
MKIERLHLVGFGKLQNCEIVFDPDKVNLLIEENEFGKSTIVAAIVAALYGFPPRERTTPDALAEREVYRPDDGGPYQVSLEVRALGRHGWTRLRILRDFHRGRARIFNLSEGGTEITDAFVRQRREVGEILLGLSREQFVNTCLVRQAALQALPDLSDLTVQLQKIADAEAGDRTAADAIRALRKALEEFPASRTGKGPLRIDTELQRVKAKLEDIREKLEQLDRERRQIEPQLVRIGALEREIEEAQARQRLAHYLRERAEYERLERARERRESLEAERHRLRQEYEALAPYETFPAAQLANLESWMGALRRITRERAAREEQLGRAHRRYAEIREQEERFGSLASFTPADREQLVVLAEQYKELHGKIHEGWQKVHAEQQRLAERGIHLEEFEQWRERVGALDLEERRRALEAEARRSDLQRQSRLAEERREEHLALCAEIERERDRARRRAERMLALTLIGGIITSIALLLGFDHASVLPGLLTALSLGLWLALRRTARTHRRQEWMRAHAEADRLQQQIEILHIERAQLEDQMRPLLARTGLDSLESLAHACRRLETLTAELQPLLLERSTLRERELELEQKRGHLRAFLDRAGRPGDEPIQEEIERLIRDLDRVFELRHERAQLEERLAQEEADREATLREEQDYRERILALLREAHAVDPTETTPSLEDIEAAVARFREGVKRYDALQRVKQKLEQVERDLMTLPELSVLLEQRTRVRESLSRREAKDPGLAAHMPERSPEEYASEAEHWSAHERARREELTQLRTQIAATFDRLEKQRPELLEQEQELKQHLERVQNFKQAVERALDIFERIAREIHDQWAEALTDISRELLRTLQTDYAALQFDRELRLRVALKERDDILQTNQLRSQLSLGTREQLSLIARLAVSRYLSRDRRLPLILDEPFANSDDARFARLMRLLLGELSREHQIIITSCHQKRHEWLKTQYPDLFAQRVHWCTLSP